MANIINADDGVISGVAGIKTSADTSGVLNIQTNGTTAISISTAQVVSFPATSGISFGGQITFAAGTAAAPSISVTGDTNTGIFFPGADIVAISTGGSERLRVDASGNMGLGVTPSAWSSTRKALQLGPTGSVFGYNLNTYLGSNFYYDGSDNRYIANGTASAYQLSSNTHYWYVAASGTAGDVLTFGDAKMMMNSSGNVGIGTTNPGSKLDVAGTARISNTTGNKILQLGQSTPSGNDAASLEFQASSTQTNWAIRTNWNVAGALEFNPSSSAGGTTYTTPSMLLSSSGNLGLGVTPSAWNTVTPLQVKNASFSGTTSQAFVGNNWYYASGDKYISTAAAGLFQINGDVFTWLNAASGTAGNAITFTERMRLDASGNLGVGTSSPAYKLDVVGSSAAFQSRFGTSTTNFGIFVNDASDFVSCGSITNDQLRFFTNGVDRATITAAGEFLVGETVTYYSSKILTKDGPISTRIANVDANYGDVFVAGYTGNTSERNIIRSAVSSIAGSSGLQFMISDGAGSSNVTESFRINRTSCTVVGSLSKGSGSFKIDHPLKPDTHHLVHSFIEGPQADLIYRGKATLVNGKATVNIDAASDMTDGTFVALCREVQCFTSNESDWDAVRGSVSGNLLTIECQNQNSTATVSWMVIGERQDKHMYDTDWTDENGKVIVEPLKELH